jgi:hypothetical protein
VGVNLLSSSAVAQRWAWLPSAVFVAALLVAVPSSGLLRRELGRPAHGYDGGRSGPKFEPPRGSSAAIVDQIDPRTRRTAVQARESWVRRVLAPCAGADRLSRPRSAASGSARPAKRGPAMSRRRPPGPSSGEPSGEMGRQTGRIATHSQGNLLNAGSDDPGMILAAKSRRRRWRAHLGRPAGYLVK